MITDREFTTAELRAVLEHYDMGELLSVRELQRGSRRSPKLLVTTSRGRFLLKRRAAGRDSPQRVAFSHALVSFLQEHNFPVQPIQRTRRGETLVAVGGHTYEAFEYLEGERYDESLAQTTSAGGALAAFHKQVAGFDAPWWPDGAGYHAAPQVLSGLNAIPSMVMSHDSVAGREAELLGLTQELYERYEAAGQRVRAAGFDDWPRQIIHGDWHPGNVLFSGQRVVAVLDFDAAQRQPAIVDLAYGMLQFSILRNRDDPDEWPDFFDATRMRRFYLGYTARLAAPRAQRAVILDLMIESLIAESAVPIAMTGSFGQLPGYGVLLMVRRKVNWLESNSKALHAWLLG